jgi:hypothetical protein
MKMRRHFIALIALTAITTGTTWAQTPAKDAQRFPDVVTAKVKAMGNSTFDFDVTVSSPYDTPQRYADAFRVTTVDGKPLGERVLFHDHRDEQPFTRDLYGVKIPAGIRKVLIQARDQKHGYGGKQIEVSLPGR